MKRRSIKYFSALLLVAGAVSVALFSFKPDTKEIHWMDFETAVKLSKAHPKKIIIDVYTSWCGWCKLMDATTYQDPEIIDYLNKTCYAVRLDAETKDTFHFGGHVFFNPGTKGAVNELAYSLLDGKLGYPTTV